VGKTVKDYRASIEKLRKDAAEAALIRDLATDPTKRQMFDRLHEHFNRLADEVENAVNASAAKEGQLAGITAAQVTECPVPDATGFTPLNFDPRAP
jgi:hypothetical protein